MWVLLASDPYLVEFTWVNEFDCNTAQGLDTIHAKKKCIYSIISPIILYIIFFLHGLCQNPVQHSVVRRTYKFDLQFSSTWPVTCKQKSFSLLFQRTIWADMQAGGWSSWFDHNERCSYRSVRVCSRGTGSDQTSGVSKWRRLVWILWTTRGT